MRVFVLVVALAACGNKKPEKVTSFVQSGVRFQVPQGWTADLRSKDLVTLTPEKEVTNGPHIVIAPLITVQPAEFKARNAEYCGKGFRSVDAVKPAGQLFESGPFHGCVTDITRSTGRQRRWELSDGRSVLSIGCNRDPDDAATAKLCEELVATAKPEP
ncbi:MAG TPA: hypothetical protein VIU61_17650 [Kofleriaceae bacterium]